MEPADSRRPMAGGGQPLAVCRQLTLAADGADTPTWGRLLNTFGLTWSRLWSDLEPTVGRLLADFWPTLGRLWVDFGPTLGRLWADFGLTLGQLWAVVILHLSGAVILHL